ncbi:hypothetical protein DAI22_09g176501 [Oryza sativa Japonica Group]|nr:hypothetical protein DAI22_09g176501 [Oryza sativa Japonica Group]
MRPTNLPRLVAAVVDDDGGHLGRRRRDLRPPSSPAGFWISNGMHLHQPWTWAQVLEMLPWSHGARAVYFRAACQV